MADLKNICLSLSQAWDDIVRKDNANDGRSQRNLSGVFVTRSIEALMEHGFILPEVSHCTFIQTCYIYLMPFTGWEGRRVAWTELTRVSKAGK